MYKRVLVAYDGSREGRSALREGALLVRELNAELYILAVVAETPGMRGVGGSVAGNSGERHGSVTEVGPRHEEPGKSTLPPVLSNRHGRAA